VTSEATSEALVEAISLLRRHLRSRVGRPWPDVDLTRGEVDVLRAVRRRPGTSVNDVASSLGLAGNSVSTVVGRLERAELLRRHRDADDGRVVRLELTPAALSRLDAWRDQWVEVLAAALEHLPDGDRAAVADAVPALRRLADTVGPDPGAAQ
jgi:DNA-binding MarR family transcriptional regulator